MQHYKFFSWKRTKASRPFVKTIFMLFYLILAFLFYNPFYAGERCWLCEIWKQIPVKPVNTLLPYNPKWWHFPTVACSASKSGREKINVLGKIKFIFLNKYWGFHMKQQGHDVKFILRLLSFRAPRLPALGFWYSQLGPNPSLPFFDPAIVGGRGKSLLLSSLAI